MPRLVLPEGRARILAIPRGYCKGYFAKNPKLTVKAVIAKRHPPPQGPSKPQPRRQSRNKPILNPFLVASYRAVTVLLFFRPAKPCLENPTIHCRTGSPPPSTATTTSANNTRPHHTAENRLTHRSARHSEAVRPLTAPTFSSPKDTSDNTIKSQAKKRAAEATLFHHRKTYSVILATTPAPTVRPPSRIAKRRPSSMAIGAISSTSICTLSPGITISVPSGRVHAPVTSVVRK